MWLDDTFLGWSVKITILISMKCTFNCSYMARPNSVEPIANKGILQIKSTASVGTWGLGLWIFNCGPLTTGLDGAYLWIWASLMTVMMMIRMQISIFTSLFIVLGYFAQSCGGRWAQTEFNSSVHIVSLRLRTTIVVIRSGSIEQFLLD